MGRALSWETGARDEVSATFSCVALDKRYHLSKPKFPWNRADENLALAGQHVCS